MVFGGIGTLVLCAILLNGPILKWWSDYQLGKTISRLIDQLDDAQPEKRQAAEEELIAIGHRALAALQHAVRGSTSEIIERARDASRRLRKLDRTNSVPKDSSRCVKAITQRWLASMGA